MEKIKITIETPNSGIEIIETTQVLVLAIPENNEDGQNVMAIHAVTSDANYPDTARIGLAAVQKVLERLNDCPSVKNSFFAYIADILSEEM